MSLTILQNNAKYENMNKQIHILMSKGYKIKGETSLGIILEKPKKFRITDFLACLFGLFLIPWNPVTFFIGSALILLVIFDYCFIRKDKTEIVQK